MTKDQVPSAFIAGLLAEGVTTSQIDAAVQRAVDACAPRHLGKSIAEAAGLRGLDGGDEAMVRDYLLTQSLRLERAA